MNPPRRCRDSNEIEVSQGDIWIADVTTIYTSPLDCLWESIMKSDIAPTIETINDVMKQAATCTLDGFRILKMINKFQSSVQNGLDRTTAFAQLKRENEERNSRGKEKPEFKYMPTNKDVKDLLEMLGRGFERAVSDYAPNIQRFLDLLGSDAGPTSRMDESARFNEGFQKGYSIGWEVGFEHGMEKLKMKESDSQAAPPELPKWTSHRPAEVASCKDIEEGFKAGFEESLLKGVIAGMEKFNEMRVEAEEFWKCKYNEQAPPKSEDSDYLDMASKVAGLAVSGAILYSLLR